MQEKREVRKIFAAARKALTPEERSAADKAIRERIKNLPAYQTCTALALYATDGTEPDLLPLTQNSGKILEVKFINCVRGGEIVNDKKGLNLRIVGVNESIVSYGE